MALNLDDIGALLRHRGAAQYGDEAVSQLEHALQCAWLAERAGEAPEAVAASLLHDLGHLIAAERDGTSDHDTDRDDLHQYLALPFLRPLFDDAVLEPIRLHVDAKRYLCLIEPSYARGLSPASVRSLAQQGGVFSEVEGEAFIHQPHADVAVRLRRYDDLAKTPGQATPELPHYLALLAGLAR